MGRGFPALFEAQRCRIVRTPTQALTPLRRRASDQTNQWLATLVISAICYIAASAPSSMGHSRIMSRPRRTTPCINHCNPDTNHCLIPQSRSGHNGWYNQGHFLQPFFPSDVPRRFNTQVLVRNRTDDKGRIFFCLGNRGGVQHCIKSAQRLPIFSLPPVNLRLVLSVLVFSVSTWYVGSTKLLMPCTAVSYFQDRGRSQL